MEPLTNSSWLSATNFSMSKFFLSPAFSPFVSSFTVDSSLPAMSASRYCEAHQSIRRRAGSADCSRGGKRSDEACDDQLRQPRISSSQALAFKLTQSQQEVRVPCTTSRASSRRGSSRLGVSLLESSGGTGTTWGRNGSGHLRDKGVGVRSLELDL
jgi:hypothetical protein